MRLRNKVRLHILTGFLGSGKSTLLRRYLNESPTAAKMVVLINEFGTVAVDHTLIRSFSNHGQSLTGGCACCDGDASLRQSLLAILTQIETGELLGIEDIILETSGISDPSRIFGTIKGEMHLAEYLEISSCVTVVESGTDANLVSRFTELHNQIACASRIILTKEDLHPIATTEKTLSYIRRLNPLAEILMANTDPNLGRLFEPAKVPRGIPKLSRNHRNQFNNFCIDIEKSLSWPEFSVWLTALLHCHGDKILRFKGIIPLTGSPFQALVLQGVRHRVYEPEHINIDISQEQIPFGLIFICSGDMEKLVRSSFNQFKYFVRAKNYLM